MVEQIVFFALGFALCGLIGLAFLPLVTARARRLTLALVEQRLPMSFDEIDAERDALRAKFATENRALEIAAAQARAKKAEDDIELGRRAVAEMRARDALTQKTAELSSRDAELASALARAAGLQEDLERVRATLLTCEAERAQAAAALDLSQAEAARLAADLSAAQKTAQDATARTRELEDERAAEPEVLASLRAAIDDLGAKIAQDRSQDHPLVN